MAKWRGWRPVLWKTLLAATIVYFVERSLPLQAIDLAAFLQHADYRFYLSMMLFAVFLMLQASIWVMIVNAAGARETGKGVEGGSRLRLLPGLRIFIDSQFAKYIPGGFWNYAGRIVLATRAGVSLAAQLASIVYENVLLVAAALAYALVLVVNLNVAPVPILLATLALAAFSYVYYGRVSSWVQRVFDGASRWKLMKGLLNRMAKSTDTAGSDRAAGASPLSRNQSFGYLVCFLGSHFVMGIAFWLLANSFDAGHISVFYAAGTFATSWLLGLLSPFPGGLGVREGFLVYFLSLKLGTDVALQLSIVARVWNVMAELTFWLLIQAASRLKRRVRSYES